MADEVDPKWAALLDAAGFALDERHPLQYGFERLQDGREVATLDVTPRPALVAGEVYNRCPTCEEWSPCSVRKAVEALGGGS